MIIHQVIQIIRIGPHTVGCHITLDCQVFRSNAIKNEPEISDMVFLQTEISHSDFPTQNFIEKFPQIWGLEISISPSCTKLRSAQRAAQWPASLKGAAM